MLVGTVGVLTAFKPLGVRRTEPNFPVGFLLIVAVLLWFWYWVDVDELEDVDVVLRDIVPPLGYPLIRGIVEKRSLLLSLLPCSSLPSIELKSVSCDAIVSWLQAGVVF